LNNFVYLISKSRCWMLRPMRLEIAWDWIIRRWI